MTFAIDSHSTNALGGTELLKAELGKRLPSELLDKFQIFVSRVEEELDPNKVRVLWCHDLSLDSSNDHLKNGGWNNFHRIVFVSHWQMNQYIAQYDIPYSRCIVIQNAINRIDDHEKPKSPIRLGYWSTPHRGLNILVPVFEKLAEKYDDIELEVFSSFGLYGWKERDAPYEDLFDKCRQHPRINYHGSVANDVIRDSIKDIHILAYPSIWAETSCLTLMEAMSAGCLCVHPNLAALPETSANWTMQYQYHEDLNQHAHIFYQALDRAIEHYWEDDIQSRVTSQKAYANVFYNWDIREKQWMAYLGSIMDEPTELPKKSFNYKSS